MNIDWTGATRSLLVRTSLFRSLVLLASCLVSARPVLGQQLASSPVDSASAAAPASAGTVAKPADEWPRKFLINWNEYNLGFTTFLWGAAILEDYASYNQDSASAAHFDLERRGIIRDSRFMFFGQLHTARPISWQSGIMYDWPTSKWKIRTSFIAVGVPEIYSTFQVGRIKEGISLNRVIGGYDGWTSERFTFSDAAIPLIADGVKWMGYVPDKHILWNLGVFTDFLSKAESFSYYRQQAVGRIAYVRADSLTGGNLLHLGVALHVGQPEHDTLKLKSKPEAFAGPNFIDTGKFPATLGTIGGFEAYYRHGSLLYGTEYYMERASSREMNNPVFHGGDIFLSWIITGETRPYSAPMGTFKAISPKRPFFQGGPGAWEAVLRVSNIDLNAADSVSGGQFWRITPMVNWHMNDQARLELSYGIGFLDRFGVRSTTEFFQARIQLQFTKLSVAED
jgi:phosphate-selective porin OprO/OprP